MFENIPGESDSDDGSFSRENAEEAKMPFFTTSHFIAILTVSAR